MPEWEIECLEDLFFHYKNRYKHGHEQRSRLNKEQLQVLEEIEFRYRLLSLLIYFCGEILNDFENGFTTDKKFYQDILKAILKEALPVQIKEKINTQISFPNEVLDLERVAVKAWRNFNTDYNLAETDEMTLYLDMMDTGEAIIRYCFMMRELFYISVSKQRKKAV